MAPPVFARTPLSGVDRIIACHSRFRSAGSEAAPKGDSIGDRRPLLRGRLRMHIMQSRRDFLASLSAASPAGVLGVRASFADEGPETTTIRIPKRRHLPRLCTSPRSCCARRLHRYHLRGDAAALPTQRVARGEIDFAYFAAPLLMAIDAGERVMVLAGVHSGASSCSPGHSDFSDLKGRRSASRGSVQATTCSSRSWQRTSG